MILRHSRGRLKTSQNRTGRNYNPRPSEFKVINGTVKWILKPQVLCYLLLDGSKLNKDAIMLRLLFLALNLILVFSFHY